MALSDESKARARYAGWRLGRHVTTEDLSWADWLRARSGAAPGSIVVDAGGFADESAPTAEDDQDHAAEEMVGALRAYLERSGVEGPGLAPLDELLFSVGTRRWRQLRDGQLVRGDAPDARRSRGGILLKVGGGAGETLLAVERVLSIQLPASPRQLFAEWFDPEVARVLGHLSQGLGSREDDLDVEAAEHRALLALVGERGPAWLATTPEVAFETFARTLWSVATTGPFPADRITPTASKGGVLAATRRRVESSGSTPGTPRRAFDPWLEDRIEEAHQYGARFAGDDPAEVRRRIQDRAALQSIRDGRWLGTTSTWLAVERLLAYAALQRDLRDVDFGRVAPLADLGPRRKPPSAGIPCLDALWAARALQESFPGRLGTGDSPLLVHSAQLVLRERDSDRIDGAVTLLPGAGRPPALRAFGEALLARFERAEHKRKDTEQFAVRFTLRGTGLASDRQAVVDVRFPWRFGARDLTGRAEHVARLRLDARRLDEAARAARALRTDARRTGTHAELPAAMGELADALADLCVAWQRWPAVGEAPAPGTFAEEAGLHTETGIWGPARDLIAGHRRAMSAFLRVFEVAGDLAPRVAHGPLSSFLEFALHDNGKGGDGAVRLCGHHPLRLQQQCELESEALEELHATLARPATLRDVPLTTLPDVRGVPPVVFSPTSDPGEDPFLVPAGSADFWNETFRARSHPDISELDLVEPLRPLLGALSRGVFPGMRRRLAVRLHGQSQTTSGLRPLLWLADAVRDDLRPQRPPLTAGVDLHVDPELSRRAGSPVPMTAAEVGVLADEEAADLISREMTRSREDQAALPLEVRPWSPTDASPDDHPDTHLCLMVGPWARRSSWSVRMSPGGVGSSSRNTSDAMTWDPTPRSWSNLFVGDGGAASRAFQALVVRRWRGEADKDLRALGLTLETDESQRLGQAIQVAHRSAAGRSLRLLLLDPYYGAEAIDSAARDAAVGAETDTLRVTYADYHRKSRWRITVLAHPTHAPDRERDGACGGLRALWESADEDLGAVVYESTHRAVPAVTRHLWSLCGNPDADVDAELVGHLGVALFASPVRERLGGNTNWPDDLAWLAAPVAPCSILLSMDALQGWTWTRRGGRRSDFILATVDPVDEDRAWILSVESKGSAKNYLHDGTVQAATACAKLRERFDGPERVRERTQLMACLAEEAFRARASHRKVHDAIGRARDIRFGAVCVSTARQRDPEQPALEIDSFSRDVGGFTEHGVWIRARGLSGIRALAGRTDPQT